MIEKDVSEIKTSIEELKSNDKVLSTSIEELKSNDKVLLTKIDNMGWMFAASQIPVWLMLFVDMRK